MAADHSAIRLAAASLTTEIEKPSGNGIVVLVMKTDHGVAAGGKTDEIATESGAEGVMCLQEHLETNVTNLVKRPVGVLDRVKTIDGAAIAMPVQNPPKSMKDVSDLPRPTADNPLPLLPHPLLPVGRMKNDVGATADGNLETAIATGTATGTASATIRARAAVEADLIASADGRGMKADIVMEAAEEVDGALAAKTSVLDEGLDCCLRDTISLVFPTCFSYVWFTW
jgi:hypothetical protein